MTKTEKHAHPGESRSEDVHDDGTEEVMPPKAKKLRTESAPVKTATSKTEPPLINPPEIAKKLRTSSTRVESETAKIKAERPVDRQAEVARGPVMAPVSEEDSAPLRKNDCSSTLRKLNVSSRCFVCQKKLQLKNDGDRHDACQVCSVENGTVVHGLKGQTAVSIRSITFCGSCMSVETTRKALQESLDIISQKMVTDKIVEVPKDRKAPKLSDFKVSPTTGSLKIYVCVRIGGCWNRIRRSHDLTSWRLVPQAGSEEPMKNMAMEQNPAFSVNRMQFSPPGLPGMGMPMFSNMGMPFGNQQQSGGAPWRQGTNLNPMMLSAGMMPQWPLNNMQGQVANQQPGFANAMNMPSMMYSQMFANQMAGMPNPLSATQGNRNSFGAMQGSLQQSNNMMPFSGMPMMMGQQQQQLHLMQQQMQQNNRPS